MLSISVASYRKYCINPNCCFYPFYRTRDKLELNKSKKTEVEHVYNLRLGIRMSNVVRY